MALGPWNLKRRIELYSGFSNNQFIRFYCTRLYGPTVAWKKSFVKYTADFSWFVLCPARCICSIGNQCLRHSTPPISEQTASRPASFWPATPVMQPYPRLGWSEHLQETHTYFAKTIVSNINGPIPHCKLIPINSTPTLIGIM